MTAENQAMERNYKLLGLALTYSGPCKRPYNLNDIMTMIFSYSTIELRGVVISGQDGTTQYLNNIKRKLHRNVKYRGKVWNATPKLLGNMLISKSNS